MTIRVNSSTSISSTTLGDIDALTELKDDPNTVMPTATPEEVQKQQDAKNQLSNDINGGNAEFVKTGVLADVLGFFLNQNKRTGNYVKISNIEKGTLYSDILKKYNLPAGSLNHMVTGGIGNNKNNYGYVTIYIDDLTTALGLNQDQIKKMFDKK